MPRHEMIALLGRIVGDGPLTADQRQAALDIFSELVARPAEAIQPTSPNAELLASGAAMPQSGAATVAAGRRLIYVHGICQHVAGYSDPWWEALRPFVSTAFGTGERGVTRLEVLWSDLVNDAAMALAAMAGPIGVVLSEEVARQAAAAEIKAALQDRMDQAMLAAAASDNASSAPLAADVDGGLFSLPGVRCVDDFSIYLTNDVVRQRIIDRFIQVVRPELEANRILDVIGHSWGSVVAYEGLRQLEEQGFTAPRIGNFFTVGAALSIGPVKSRLRPANRNGAKPANVRRWLNLDARGDIVGGPLQGRPYEVDRDFVNLEPFGCGSFLGLVNPSCAHGSYFKNGNEVVNKSIFGDFIVNTTS